MSVLAELDCATSAERFAAVATLTASLCTEAADIADAMYPIIGRFARSPVRPLLVALRRAVFETRAPGDLPAKVAGALPGNLLARIQEWAARNNRRAGLALDLPRLLAADVAAALPGLRRLAGRHDVQRGLALAAPVLLDEVRAWVSSGASQPPAERVLSGLARHVCAAAVRPGPVGGRVCGRGRWQTAATIATLHAPHRPTGGATVRGPALNTSTVNGPDPDHTGPDDCVPSHSASNGIASCDPHRLRPALDDLGALRPLLALSDPKLPLRLALAGYLRERWGPGTRVPFCALYNALHDAADEDGPVAVRDLLSLLMPDADPVAPTRSRFAPLRALGELHDRVAADLAALTLTAGAIAHVHPRRLREVAGAWPRHLAGHLVGPGSIMVDAQLAGVDQPVLVVDAVAYRPGLGPGAEHHVYRSVGDRPEPMARPHASSPAGLRSGRPSGVDWGRDAASRPGPGGTAPRPEPGYEVIGPLPGMDARARGMKHLCAVPGTAAYRRIPLRELVVVDDAAAGPPSLWWPRCDVPVRPAPVNPQDQPPSMIRFLVDIFGPAAGPVLPVDRSCQPCAAGADGQVIARPRLQVGHVVIRRAAWLAGREALPPSPPGVLDAGWMLRMLGWLDEHGIPRRCFLSPGTAAAPSAALDDGSWPVYVDFTNWFHALAARRLFDDIDGPVRFEEALPAPDGALPAPDGTAYTAAFVFDVPEEGGA